MKAAYLGAIGAGWCSPTEFWRMHPDEFWWLYEARMPEREAADEWADLYEALG